MKYNTISTSSLGSVARKSTLTLYTDPEFINEKAQSSELASVRGELEIVQRALKLQTKRCRQLVTEYTRRLQEKEQQYQSEKLLRDNQLAKVLRALLIFEARLKQEQKYISHQLNEKDYIINKQRDDIDKLSNQYCKHCNQYYNPILNLESLGSSSEYVGTDYQDYQSSNLESLDSSSETYGTISEKEFEPNKIIAHDSEDEKVHDGKIFVKNIKCGKDSYSKRAKKNPVRKSVGTYFEVLKLRNDAHSPVSNEDNTSNDYDNLESLPAESVSGKISDISERIENIFAKCASANLTEDNLGKHDNQFNSNCGEDDIKECIDTKIECNTASELTTQIHSEDLERLQIKTDESVDLNEKISQITESIPVFDADTETNDNWYASASDQEEDQQRDIYRNNPVLECMNQILLQNIDDNINSPPKTPTLERKINKNNKRVKFIDEGGERLQNGNYYEIPIQKTPNFYETPQSIYSNDYEQILSKSSEVSSTTAEKSDYYVDMDTKSENEVNEKKVKILRPPPALPPKPANLLSKYKIPSQKNISTKIESTESEPDYCSISELNLPTQKTKKINVVAEVNCDLGKISENHIILHSPKSKSHYDLDSEKPDMIVTKNIDRVNIQVAKQTPIKNDSPNKTKLKVDQEIPKLPQVSEIIIPEETPTNPASPKKEELISSDNYIKNNTQLIKNKTRPDIAKRSIMMGSTVSSLISSFNNQQLLSEIQNKPLKGKLNKKMFSSFECLQNLEKQTKTPQTHSFDKFDLSQNFEEFKLDDCDIEEYNVEKHFEVEEKPLQINSEIQEEHVLPEALNISRNLSSSSTRVEMVRATNDVIVPQLNQNSIEQLKKKLDLEKNKNDVETYEQLTVPVQGTEANYEHFLECTGLSSKSILTPSRMLSNHKSMLKPKDVKLRSKVRSTIFERQNSAIKYWYEPYV